MKTKAINQWANDQRKQFNKGTLESWKVDALEFSGFNWDKHDPIRNFMSDGNRYLPFKQAREMARSLNLSSWRQWLKYHNEHQILNIPLNPNIVYKKQWKSYSDWIGK
jgi:hypothetical protein